MTRRPSDRTDPDVVRDLGALHEAMADQLFGFALRATGDRQAAEEITQDTFVRAWRAADRFDPERGDVRTWLFAITRNLVADHWRRRGARPVAPAPDDRLDRGALDEDLDRVVEAWQLEQAFGRLSREHREAIAEIHLRGASVAETARRLGVPPGTVKSRVYYGLRAFRVALEELGVLR